MNFRVDPESKRLIEQAARRDDRSVSDYCISVLTAAAREKLSEEEALVMTAAQRDAFWDAVMNPPPPSDRLKRAFERHADLSGGD